MPPARDSEIQVRTARPTAKRFSSPRDLRAVIIAFFAAATPAAGFVCEVEASEPETPATAYKLQSSIRYYGVDTNDKLQQIGHWNQVSMYRVEQREGTYIVKGFMENELIQSFLSEDTNEDIPESPLVPISTEIALDSGERIEAPPRSVFFTCDIPQTSFDLFYLPFYNSNLKKLRSPQGVVKLTSPSVNTTTFKGQWFYTSFSELDRTHITGPLVYHNADRSLEFTGTISHEVRLDPLTFYRSSGELVLTITPAEKYAYFDKDSPLRGKLKSFKYLRGVHSYRLLRRDSKEGESIPASERLRATFDQMR